MWPFNRRKKTGNGKVPKEVKDYYTSEHRERVGLAWLIAFISLVVTVAIILGLFYGGRWVYRSLTDDDKGTETTETEQPAQPTPGEPSGDDRDETLPDGSTTEGSDNEQETTPDNQSASETANRQTPSTGDTLASTGPAHVLVIFGASSAVGAVAHNIYSRRKK